MTSTRRRLAAILTLATVLVAGAAIPAAAGTPVRKVALGVSMQPYTNMGNLDQFIADTGRPPALYSVWSTWGGAFSKDFPTSLLDQIKARGSVGATITPVILWEPTDPSNPNSQAFTYKKINAGNHDAYIRAWAQAAKDWGGTVILRLAPEMNGYWWPWGTQSFDNTPANFIKAWKRIYNIFKGPSGVGATNVKFLWSPNKPCGQCDTMASVFPGKAFVDYMGFSAFNWSTPQKWKGMAPLFKGSYDALKALSAKPIIVSETATSYVGGNKVAWIRDGYKASYTAYPQIKGILYFNIDTTDRGERDWRLTVPDNAPLTAYKNLLTLVKFQGVIS